MAPEKLLAEWFWIDRWMGSRAFGLPIEARGLYREMLSQAWRRGAQLPNDHQQIQRITGVTSKEWKRTWPDVEQFWRVDGDCLVNDTQLQIYAEAKGRSEKASERGIRGAQARLKHNSSSAQVELKLNSSTAQAPLEHKPPSPISDHQSPKEQTRVRVLHSSPQGGRPEREAVSLDPNPDDPDVGERASWFVGRYGELYQQHRNGARYLPRPALDYEKAKELCAVWPSARLERLAIVFLKTDHDFAASGSRTIGQFAALASWCDDRLTEVEKAKRA